MKRVPLSMLFAIAALLASLSVGASTASATSPHITGPATPGMRWESPTSGTCAYGDACHWVWDADYGAYRRYDLTTCGEYAIYYWYGYGWVLNNQTGPTDFALDSSHGFLAGWAATNTLYPGANWNPVWYLQPC